MDLRLSDHYRAVRRFRKRCQHITDPFCKRCAAQQAVRNVRPKLHAALLQFFQGKTEMKQPVHPDQNCCRIRAAARKSRRHRDIFLQIDRHAMRDAKLFHQKIRRLINKIFRTGRKIAKVHTQADARFLRLPDPNLIIQINALHDHS